MYKYCPKCGNKLIKFNKGFLCYNNSCRVVIKNNSIYRMSLDEFIEIQDVIGEQNNSSNSYMLLKEDLSAPLLIKNTNSPLERNKNTYCIIRAKNLDDALEQFSSKFSYIKVNKDMIVKVNINEC